MSDEPKRKETEQEKQERREKEIAALMDSMDRTAPPADTELLNSIRVGLVESPVPVKPADISASAPLSPTLEGALRRPSVSLAPGVKNPEYRAAGAELPIDEVLLPANPEQFTIEATISEIARAAKKYSYPDTSGRGSVRISEDIFSRITMVYAKARIDKILVLSYLLYSHVPAEGVQRVPKWILEPPPKMPRPRILVFIKDEDLARRLSDTAIRFGITEADIVENIVRKHIPEAPFQYRPKRRMRFSA